MTQIAVVVFSLVVGPEFVVNAAITAHVALLGIDSKL
jgi:hypothetical protein